MTQTCYTLLSGVAQHAKNPDLFGIPSDPERRLLMPGDCVKLMFASQDEEEAWVERMWLQIDHVDYPNFRGRLANEPLQPDAFGLHFDDAVVFHARHIIEYEKRS